MGFSLRTPWKRHTHAHPVMATGMLLTWESGRVNAFQAAPLFGTRYEARPVQGGSGYTIVSIVVDYQRDQTIVQAEDGPQPFEKTLVALENYESVLELSARANPQRFSLDYGTALDGGMHYSRHMPCPRAGMLARLWDRLSSGWDHVDTPALHTSCVKFMDPVNRILLRRAWYRADRDRDSTWTIRRIEDKGPLTPPIEDHPTAFCLDEKAMFGRMVRYETLLEQMAAQAPRDRMMDRSDNALDRHFMYVLPSIGKRILSGVYPPVEKDLRRRALTPVGGLSPRTPI